MSGVVGTCLYAPGVSHLLFSEIYGHGKLKRGLSGVYLGFPPEGYPEGEIPGKQNGGYHDAEDIRMHTDCRRLSASSPVYHTTYVHRDSNMEDAGFVYLSGSDRYHDEFLGARARCKQELGVLAETSGYIELTRKEIDWFLQKGCKWTKVVAPQGSVIIWNHRLRHVPPRQRSPGAQIVLSRVWRVGVRGQRRAWIGRVCGYHLQV